MIKRISATLFLYCLITQPSYSLTLAETFRETVSNNPDILTSSEDYKAIQQAFEQAKAPFFPKLRVNLGYGPDRSLNSNTITDATGPTPVMPKREEGVTIDQMIFDGFATRSDVARNSARVNSAAYKVLNSIQDTVQRDVEVYLGVLREQELVLLAKQNLEFHEKIAYMIELRAKSGLSRLADVYQAQARLSLARSNLLAEQSNMADAQANFVRTIGFAPGTLLPVPTPDDRYIPKTENQALEVAMMNNPVVRSANADIYAAIEQHKVANATNFPRLDVQVGNTWDRNVGGVRGPSFDRFAIVRMTYTLFNGGADIGKQRETAYQIQEAKEIKNHAIRQLIEAVRLTWDLYTTAFAQIPWLTKHVVASEHTVNAYAKEYIIGHRTLLDLLDSQNELFAAKRAYVSGKYDVIQAKYRLLRDMGISIVALNLEHCLPDPSYVPIANNVNINPLTPTHTDQHPQLPPDTSVLQANPAAKVWEPLSNKMPLPKPTLPKIAITAAAAAPTPIAPLSTPTLSAQNWAIQVGSFKSKENAERLAAELRKEGDSIFTADVHSSQGTVTRVYVGPESQLATAKLKQAKWHGVIVPYRETDLV